MPVAKTLHSLKRYVQEVQSSRPRHQPQA
jgi:PAS domain S-box-containing protein